MFKDYDYIKSCGYDEGTKMFHCQYRIIDTDFEEIVVASETLSAIIDCYTKRGLPVAPNLIRYMLQFRDKCGAPLDWQVKWNKQHNPRWQEVEKDMQMYLAFS